MELPDILQTTVHEVLVCVAPSSLRTPSRGRGSIQVPWKITGGPNVHAVASERELLPAHLSISHSQEAQTTIHISTSRPWRTQSLEEIISSLDSHALPLPTAQDFACILRKCRKARNSSFLLRLFGHIHALGHDADPPLGNNLVSMLAEAGYVHEAKQVFDRLEVCDESSCNSLITGYVKCGQLLLALNLYKQMEPDDLLHISGHSFVALIKACTKSRNLELGSRIHACVAKKGLLQKDRFLGSALVDMYAKCNSLSKAQELFDTLAARDVVSWNALISAYARNGSGEEALKCFRQMQLDGFTPTPVTFVCCLKACGTLGDRHQSRILDAEVSRLGLDKDLIVGSALIDMHVKCGLLEKAEEVFHKLSMRNVVSWTALIKGYIEQGHAEEALNHFEQMQEEGISPDAVAFLCALKACSLLRVPEKGQKLHGDISRVGLDKDLLLGCTLVDMYSKCGLLNKAQEVFDKLPTKDVMAWNTLMGGFVECEQGQEALQRYEKMQQDGIFPNAVSFVLGLKACGSLMNLKKGREIHTEISKQRLDRDLLVGSSLIDMYAKCGALEIAQKVFDNLSVQDVVSWTALIGGYTDFGQGQKALDCFKEMQYEGLSPNAITIACSLKACGNEGVVDRGQEIHAKIAKTGLLEQESILGHALIDMYAKCGLAVRAQLVFNMMVDRDVVSWNALIAGYAQLGKSEAVLFTLNKMVEGGKMPSVVTFVSALNACSHAGLVDLGLMLFDSMTRHYRMIPVLEHHTCMVDLFCRAGQIENALSLINEMQIDPDLAVWHTLLGACQKGRNVELGKQAFEEAVYRNGLDASTYVSWSNIYHDDVV